MMVWSCPSKDERMRSPLPKEGAKRSAPKWEALEEHFSPRGLSVNEGEGVNGLDSEDTHVAIGFFN